MGKERVREGGGRREGGERERERREGGREGRERERG